MAGFRSVLIWLGLSAGPASENVDGLCLSPSIGLPLSISAAIAPAMEISPSITTALSIDPSVHECD